MAPLKLKNHSWLSPVWWAKGFLALVPFFSVSSWLKALWLSRIVYNDGKWLTGWRGNLFTSCAAIHLVKPHHCLNPQPWILRKAIYLGLLVWAPVPHPHPLPQFPTPFAETWIAILLYLPMAILIKIKHSFVRKKPKNISDPYVSLGSQWLKSLWQSLFFLEGDCFRKGSSLTFSLRHSCTLQQQWKGTWFPKQVA